MIIVLPDQLAHLLHGVVGKRRGRGDIVDERNFRLNHHAILIGQLIRFRIVLPVRQTQAGCADVFYEHEIGLALRAGQRPAAVQPVLVHTDTVQRVGLAIQKKTKIRIKAERAEAQRLGHGVQQIGAVPNLHGGADKDTDQKYHSINADWEFVCSQLHSTELFPEASTH